MLSFTSLARITLTTLLAALASAGAAAQTYVLFDLPGTGTTDQATVEPTAINASGTVVGNFTLSLGGGGDGLSHGFIRSADGTVIVVATPGVNTEVTGINASGAAVGHADTAFVRAPDGGITTFMLPGAVGTQALAINASGDVAGTYYTANFTEEGGFVLTATGLLTKLTGADSLNASLVAINDLGDAAGTLVEPVGGIRVSKGVVLGRNGTQTRFEAAQGKGGYTRVAGINNSGSVAGYAANEVCLAVPNTPCFDALSQGFVRKANGLITRFVVRDGLRARKTYVRAINGSGAVVGEHVGNAFDANAPVGGFVRDGAGALVSFQVPGMKSTYPTAINDSGVIAGHCLDAQNVRHGFLRLP